MGQTGSLLAALPIHLLPVAQCWGEEGKQGSGGILDGHACRGKGCQFASRPLHLCLFMPFLGLMSPASYVTVVSTVTERDVTGRGGDDGGLLKANRCGLAGLAGRGGEAGRRVPILPCPPRAAAARAGRAEPRAGAGPSPGAAGSETS